MVAIALAPLIPLISRLGIAGTKTFLKSPMGKKILDSLVGGSATAYGLERTGVADKLFNLPEGVVSGEDLSSDPAEVARKKAERQAALDEARRNRTSATVADKVRDAAEAGDFGFNPFIDIDPDAGKPQIEVFPELTEAEKLPQTTGGVIDLNDLISRPLIMAQDPDAGKATTLSTPVLGPEDQLPTIYTMAKIKDKDLVYVGGDIKSKIPKYLVDETTGNLKEEYQKKGNEGEDSDKLISMRGVYKLPKYMLNEKKFTRKDGKKDTSYTIKDEYKNPEELERLNNSEKVKDIIVEYYNNNPDAYAVMKNKDVTKLGSEEVKNLRQYVIDNYNIDFGIKTYEKILNQTFGSRKKEGKRLQPQTDAIGKFQTIIRDYSKDKFGETLTNPQVDRYIQEFRIAIETENPDKKKGEYYTNEQITNSANFVIDTVFKGKYREKFDVGYDRDLTSYIQNKLERTAQTKEKFETYPEAFDTNIQTIGHKGTVRERIVGEGGDKDFYETQTLAKNKLQQNLDIEHRTARQKNNVEKIKEIEQRMKDNDIRSMYTDKDGNRIFIGAYSNGGLVGISHLTRPLGNF